MTGNPHPRQLAEQLLEESLEDLYEHAPWGYVFTFPDGVFAKVNQTFLDWTGYERDELLAGKRFQDLPSSMPLIARSHRMNSRIP